MSCGIALLVMLTLLSLGFLAGILWERRRLSRLARRIERIALVRRDIEDLSHGD